MLCNLSIEQDTSFKLAIVSPHAHFALRLNRVQGLMANGVEVYAIAPPGSNSLSLQQAGARFFPWNLKRRSRNPIREMISIWYLMRIYKCIVPAIAHCFTIKPNIYGAIAARLAGVPIVITTVTGLGYIFSENTWRGQMLRFFVSPFYKIAFSLSNRILFSNRDDLELFVGMKMVSRDKTCVLPGSESVDTDFFNPDKVNHEDILRLKKSLNLPDEGLVVTMIARMLWHKGVAEYVQCARIIKDYLPSVQFLLVGPIDQGNPASIPREQLNTWSNAGMVHYTGKRNDVRELLALTDIFVLPSYYPEGLPTVLLEASAMGKPIVSTDTPGCRDVVKHNVNGFLVPPRNIHALTQALVTLLTNDKLRKQFGQVSRKRAMQEFDERKMLMRLLHLYKQL